MPQDARSGSSWPQMSPASCERKSPADPGTGGVETRVRGHCPLTSRRHKVAVPAGGCGQRAVPVKQRSDRQPRQRSRRAQRSHYSDTAAHRLWGRVGGDSTSASFPPAPGSIAAQPAGLVLAETCGNCVDPLSRPGLLPLRHLARQEPPHARPVCVSNHLRIPIHFHERCAPSVPLALVRHAHNPGGVALPRADVCLVKPPSAAKHTASPHPSSGIAGETGHPTLGGSPAGVTKIMNRE